MKLLTCNLLFFSSLLYVSSVFSMEKPGFLKALLFTQYNVSSVGSNAPITIRSTGWDIYSANPDSHADGSSLRSLSISTLEDPQLFQMGRTRENGTSSSVRIHDAVHINNNNYSMMVVQNDDRIFNYQNLTPDNQTPVSNNDDLAIVVPSWTPARITSDLGIILAAYKQENYQEFISRLLGIGTTRAQYIARAIAQQLESYTEKPSDFSTNIRQRRIFVKDQRLLLNSSLVKGTLIGGTALALYLAIKLAR